MTFEQAKLLSEEMELIRFKYKGKNSHDKFPKVMVIDSEYPGKQGEKNYGKTKDVLGVNLRNAESLQKRNELRNNLSRIDLFSDFLGCDKLERYNRIKDFYPDSLKYIRRYKRSGMSHIKIKRGLFYHKYAFTNKDNYPNDY